MPKSPTPTVSYKEWLHAEAARLQIKPHALAVRLWRGKHPYPPGLVRGQRRAIAVQLPLPAGEGRVRERAKAVRCPQCKTPGTYIRDRGFKDGIGHTFMCANAACPSCNLYFYAPLPAGGTKTPKRRP